MRFAQVHPDVHHVPEQLREPGRCLGAQFPVVVRVGDPRLPAVRLLVPQAPGGGLGHVELLADFQDRNVTDLA